MSHVLAPVHEVFLNPGELYFGAGQTRISTLLGSCVSITLWHPHKHIGGMCHFQVPERGRPAGGTLDGKFGDEAFALLLAEIARSGTQPQAYEVKLFGGGAMFETTPTAKLDIGERNLAKAEALLAAHGLVPVAEHIGGQGRRKLHFELWNGHVWLSFPDGRNAKTKTTRKNHDG